MSEHEKYERALIKTNEFVREFGEITDPADTIYVKSVVNRISHVLEERRGYEQQFKIVLLDGAQPLAFSPGSGFILISRGMIGNLQSEGELAFVLAHEMSHYALNHLPEMEEISNSRDLESQQDLEREADLYGVGLIALAGYDPRVATHAIIHAYGARALAAQSVSHPDLLSRAQAVERAIINSGWRPPGTIDRRDFRRLRAKMLS